MKRFRMTVEGNIGDLLADRPIEELKQLMQEDLNLDEGGHAKIVSLEEIPLLPEGTN